MWMGLIFYMSAQTAEDSSKMSDGIVYALIKIVAPDFENMTVDEQLRFLDTFRFVVRKLAHFTEYFVLGCLTPGLVLHYTNSVVRVGLIAAAWCVTYAITDEFHQMFTDGRGPAVRDVCIDSAGAITGIVILLAVTLLIRRRRSISASQSARGGIYESLDE